VRRIKILAGLGVLSVLVLGLVAWQFRGEWLDNPSPDVSVTADETADGEMGLLADAGGQPMTLYEDDQILGNPDAPITIIEYASLTCPHCAYFHSEILPEIKENYIDQGLARLVFRDFPLDRVALHGAQIAHCAPNDAYFRVIDVMFRTQEQWVASTDPVVALDQIGRTGGITPDALAACIEDEALVKKILERAQTAQDLYGLNSTPSFVINGQIVKGAKPYEEFDQILREMLPKS
jgi:protein-disulfide isomerase